MKSNSDLRIDQVLLANNGLHKKVKELKAMLAVEYMRNTGDRAWDCTEKDCPHFNKPVGRGSCQCYFDFENKHIAAVRRELGFSNHGFSIQSCAICGKPTGHDQNCPLGMDNENSPKESQ